MITNLKGHGFDIIELLTTTFLLLLLLELTGLEGLEKIEPKGRLIV
jgi:hypothetical protein